MDFVVVAAEPQRRLTRPSTVHLDFSLEVYSSSTDPDSGQPSTSTASPPPPPPRLEDAEEFCALVDRAAFFRDLMKSFPPLRSGARSPPRVIPCSVVGTTETSVDDASFEVLDNPNHSANMAPAQWERVERQFRLDVPREELLIDGVRYRDADSATAAVRKFSHEVLARCRGATVASETGGPRGARPSCAASPGGSSGLLSWIWPLGSGSRGGEGGGGADAAQHSQEGWEFAGITPDQLMREIVLLSQQSVLAFLLESIQVHVVSTTRERSSTWNPIIVGEVSPAGRSDGEKATAGGGAAVPFTSMRVEIFDRKSGTSFLSQSLGEPGCACSSSAAAGGNRVDAVSRPVPVLQVTKYFRVFDIGEEGAQRTLDIVRAELLVELLGSPNDPVQLRWSRVPRATS